MNLLFQLRLWWFRHFIRWLTDCMKGRSKWYFTKLYRLTSLIHFFFPYLGTLIFPLQEALHSWRGEWVGFVTKPIYYYAFTSASTNASIGSPHVATWIRIGYNSILLILNAYDAFYVGKRKGEIIFQGLLLIFFNYHGSWAYFL